MYAFRAASDIIGPLVLADGWVLNCAIEEPNATAALAGTRPSLKILGGLDPCHN